MLTIGSSVGPYHVLRRLGAGGMGEVYLATDMRLGRRVALKSLAAARFLGSEQARRALLREARAVAHLNHPHIATLYDVVERENACVIVMEYVEGETLATRLRRGRLSASMAVEVALELADGLEAAHTAGIVHRDLKPSNVVLTEAGHAKILDFGLARTLGAPAREAPSPAEITGPAHQGGSGSSSWNELAVGTLPYMAPEQVAGEPGDERSDLYSLGVVLFEMLTGHRPFDAGDRAALARQILSGSTPTVGEINPDVDPGLDRIVGRAMARAAADRPASARQLKAELAQVSRELEDTRSFLGRDQTRDQKRELRRRFVLAGLPLAAAIGLLLHLTAPPRSSSGSPLMVAVLPLLSTSGEVQDEALAAGIGEVLSSALVKVQGIGVVPAAATREFRSGRDLRRVARNLGVSWLVDGAVQRSGDEVRVTLTLVEGTTLLARWSESFDGAQDRVFDLQNLAATGLAAALDVSLDARERQRLAEPPTGDVGAFAAYAHGRALLDRPDRPGNVEGAIVSLETAVRQDPRFALAHGSLGEAYWMRFLQTHDPELTVRARDAVSQAVALDPGHPLVHYSLALLCERTGRLDQAIEAADRALALQPRNDDARRLRGRALVRTGLLEEGMAAFASALAVRPRYWKNHEELGLAHYDRGRFSEALASFREVTSLQPDNSWGFYLTAMAHLARGELDLAGMALQRAMTLHPGALAHSGRGFLRFQGGAFAEARADFARALELEPNPVDYRNLGDTLVRLDQAAEARACYEKALELAGRQVAADPGDARALGLLAVYEAKLGRFGEAQRHAAEAAARAPWDAEVHYRQAAVAALSGRAEEALTTLKTALGQGFSPALARMDPDLSGLRDLEPFERVMALHGG